MDAKHRSRIEALYLRMYDQLFEYARSSLMDDPMAEEAVQETFRIACQKPDALCGSASPEGWLFVTLKNVIANMIKCRKTAERILRDYFELRMTQITQIDEREGIRLLFDELAQQEDFKLLKEMVVDGRTQLEMAQSRGISLEACRKRVQRAKETLRQKIKDYAGS